MSMNRWLKRWNWAGLGPQCRLRADRVVPIADPPLLLCPDQRTSSDTVQVESESRAGRRSARDRRARPPVCRAGAGP
jgi:hypothetical protein